MTYLVIVSRPAERDIRRIRDQRVLRQLSNAIEALAENPYPPQAHKLRAFSEIWRIRVGDWRICYTIEDGRLIVLVLIVGQRGDVYERLRRRLG